MSQDKRSGHVFIEGKLKWARLVTPNQYGQWDVLCYPNKEGMDVLYDLKKQGVKNTIKKDDDGYNINFRRPTSRIIKGKDTSMTPPLIIGPNGEPMDGSAIGNGSSGIVDVEWYRYTVPGTFSNTTEKKGIAIRLYGVKITDLVAFASESDYTTEEKEKLKGLIRHEPVY